MLTFLRKVRKSLIGSGSVSRYVLYAAGEILLVVVGILIALQINAWNEARKTHQEEIQLLLSFKSSLQSDIKQLNQKLERAQSDIKDAEFLLNFIKTDLPLHDSLCQYFRIITSAGQAFIFRPQISAYKSMEAKGVDIIKNQALKKSILDIYNIDQSVLNGALENYKDNIRTFGRPIARKQFQLFESAEYRGIMPIDYETIKDDPEFKNVLTISISNNKINIRQSQHLKAKSKAVIHMIEQELDD